LKTKVSRQSSTGVSARTTALAHLASEWHTCGTGVEELLAARGPLSLYDAFAEGVQ